jgi:dTDP-4-amino-4,6-dideoxygalactose transaminase
MILRVHGSRPKYYHKVIGGNFRLDALQAVILMVKLAHLDDWTAARQSNAKRYRELFRQEGLEGIIGLPVEKEGRHIYNQFVIAVQSQRDELRRSLNEVGVRTEVYYPVPMHLQPCFEYLGGKEADFPEAEAAADKTLALPIYAELTNEQQAYVVQNIKAFHSS